MDRNLLLRLAKRLQGKLDPDRPHVVANAQNLDGALEFGPDLDGGLPLRSLCASERTELVHLLPLALDGIATCGPNCLV